jgi:predicted dehydrogenase
MATLLAGGNAAAADQYRIVTLDPGHFHAALIQKQSLPELSEEASVYAPLGSDLTAHLNRIAGFNARKDKPTSWRLRVYAGPDYQERLLAERPGNIVVLSGNNRGKIQRLAAITGAKMHVLADKPWVVEAADLESLSAALDGAERQGVVAYDGMTQRFEVTCILQRELTNDEAVFGRPLSGSPEEPAVYMESVHYLLKLVAGLPNLRPTWFFDVNQLGEGLTDVGTHLVDLVQWTMFPGEAIDYRKDVRVLAGSHWPTVLTLPQFQRVTGDKDFPAYLQGLVREGSLQYFCNNSVTYTIRGVHTKLDVKWDYEAPPGQLDTELAIFRGTRARVEMRQGKNERFVPEVYVVPNASADHAGVRTALLAKVRALQDTWKGLEVKDLGSEFKLVIPEQYRIGHEAHFALLVNTFLKYVKNPGSLPSWEKPNMLAKYYVTTKGVELARQGSK